jgi:sugar phosphate isomerase/epimerase
MKTPITDRLAVCSWSLQPATAEQLFAQLRPTGVPRLQIALDPIRENPAGWNNLKALCAQEKVSLVSGMFGTVGEDYTTMETIRETGGLVPDGTWEQNWRNIQRNVDLAVDLGLSLVTFHAGFLPHEESDPAFRKLLDRISRVADVFSARGISLAFETGQETAETLNIFLEKLNRPTVGVNFDPANMILYEKGDPIEALRALGRWLKQCHIKDARKTKQPGTWGDEVVVGTGEVDWNAFFKTCDDLRFEGYFGIEREAGSQRGEDIRTAREFVERLAVK